MFGAPRSRSAHARRAQASPLPRLVSDHLHRLQTVYDERFAREYGPWRPVVAHVADKFLACGILEHGFARIRCHDCPHEYVLAFSCKSRYFCPSCNAKRLAIWTQWLDTTLLAPVPRRQVVPSSGRAPTVCIGAVCSARSPASPPAPSRPSSGRSRASATLRWVSWRACRRTALGPTGTRTCTSSSRTEAFGLMGRSLHGPCRTPPG